MSNSPPSTPKKMCLPLELCTSLYIITLPTEGRAMATSRNPHTKMLRELATLMHSVAGESVGMMKRSAPDRALKLKPKDEWGIYLEFLTILFNLADRFSAMHFPLKEQPQLMDSLEDAVAEHLKTAMAPALSADTDPMEFVITIGKAVSESRELYEPFRFMATDESKEKDAWLALLGNRVAEAMGTTDDGMVPSAAILCVSAAIAAMNAFFAQSAAGTGAGQPEQAESTDQAAATAGTRPEIGNEMKLASVMSSIQREEVETRWGLHPQFRHDLSRQEMHELSKLMNRVTRILGERYATVAFSEAWAAWQQPGHA